jgi:hydrogenase-4 component B
MTALFGDPRLALGLALVGCCIGIAACAVVTERQAPKAIAYAGTAGALGLLWAGLLGLGGAHFELQLWPTPLGTLHLALRPLGAFIECLSALVFVPASIYSNTYLSRYYSHYSLRWFGALYFALLASVALIPLAHDILSFFIVWEAMTIASTLLVAFEHRRQDTVEAAFWMLGMGEAGTLAALAGWLWLAGAGSIDFDALAAAGVHAGPLACLGVFLLGFFGFAVKAGLVPVNPWLPRAHPVAPGNVSALLSAVILNLGIYGIVLTLDWLAPNLTTGMGILVLVIGAVTAIVGILYATIDDDIKRMLAFSSIENLGLVATALGASIIFELQGLPAIALLARVAAFYHLANHAVAKALLFLIGATIDARTGHRDMNRLGGLLRTMPWTGAAFLVGALSLASLPPFGGFVGEWLILQSLLRSGEISAIGVKIVVALVGATIALTAALAVTCFAKAFAMTFLGPSRSGEAAPAEAPRGERVAFAVLATATFLLGVLPTYVIPGVAASIAPRSSAAVADLLVPPFFQPTRADGTAALPPAFVADFHALGAQVGKGVVPGRGLVVMLRGGPRNPVIFAMSMTYFIAVLGTILALVAVLVRIRARRVRRAPAWDGALPRLLPELTYSASGFSNPVRVIFAGILHSSLEERRERIAEHFRSAILLTRHDTYFAERWFALPIVRLSLAVARALARMHHGRLNAYVGYSLATFVVVVTIGFISGALAPR